MTVCCQCVKRKLHFLIKICLILILLLQDPVLKHTVLSLDLMPFQFPKSSPQSSDIKYQLQRRLYFTVIHRENETSFKYI